MGYMDVECANVVLFTALAPATIAHEWHPFVKSVHPYNIASKRMKCRYISASAAPVFSLQFRPEVTFLNRTERVTHERGRCTQLQGN